VALAQLNINFVRTFGSFTFSALGLYLAALRTAPTLLGGFFTQPFKLPPCVDVSYPMNVFLWLNTAVNSAIDGQLIRFDLAATRLSQGGVIADSALAFSWPVPNGWTTTQPQRVLLASGAASYPAHSFVSGDELGFRVDRNGPNAADTYAQSTDMAAVLELEYTSRCRLNCCP
jgi:hypothetical protein